MSRAPGLDLDRPRDLVALLGTTVRVFLAHSGVLYLLTLIATAPVVVLVDGVWGGVLAGGASARPSTAQAIVSLGLSVLVLPAIVTGLHVRVVLRAAAGEAPTVLGALREVGPRLPAALAATVLYVAGMIVGFVALFVPGAWVGVRWYFCVPAAVAEDRAPLAAIRRSAEVVDTRWWRTFGCLLAAGVVRLLLELPAQLVNAPTDNGVLFTASTLVFHTLIVSLSALFGTLLFFDSRARTGRAVATA